MPYCVIFGAVLRKSYLSLRYCGFKNVQAAYGFYQFGCAILMFFCAVFGLPLRSLKYRSQVLSCDSNESTYVYII